MTIFTTHIFAQEGFKMGIQAGLPFNDFNEALSVVVGVDVVEIITLALLLNSDFVACIFHSFSEIFNFTVFDFYYFRWYFRRFYIKIKN